MTPTQREGKKNRIWDSLDPWQTKRMQRIAFVLEQMKARKEVDEYPFLGFKNKGWRR